MASSTSPSPPPFSFLFRPFPLFLIATLLRIVLLLYGTWQDANSAVKYTDIDYLVFTDAARSVALGDSPYARETYRYTPLLAWLLLPTTRFFAFGKIVFALADLLAGWLIVRVLLRRGSGSNTKSSSGKVVTALTPERAGAFAALWLWNPMVATISTRGSSEGLLGVLTMALLWAVERRRVGLAGAILGLGVHFKIYPFIYAPAIVWWMDDENLGKAKSSIAKQQSSLVNAALKFCSPERIQLTIISLLTFMGLNVLMYSIYGHPFLVHSYFHHVTRIDHRHNFSPYNILLYLTSADPSTASFNAFIPQLLLSCILIPFAIAKKNLATSMMAQTFAFVTFNKVCTSQYFLWYMVFLPLYLPGSSLLRNPKLGIIALGLWVATQGAWLQQGYQLEFLGVSTFFPGLWLSALAFFLVNCWLLGIIVTDGATGGPLNGEKQHTE